jgi:conjugal transfer pilus assembly protein TraU
MLYMLGVFLDTACFQQADMDIAYLSEPDPTWNMDGMAAYLAPESVLFGNPVVALTCSADAIAASIYYTMDALFMCKGSHGMAYPMTGNVQPKNYVEDSASVAENMIYHEHRLGTGTTPGLCFKIPTPIWKKSDYRLQIVKPLPHVMGMTVGQSGLMWTYAKNVPYKGDNFVYLVFKKVNCCAF